MSTWTAKAHQLRAAQARILADILNDTDQDDPALDAYKNRHLDARSAAGDQQRLRMIPIQARGVGGTIPGTNPPDKLLSRERWRNNR